MCYYDIPEDLWLRLEPILPTEGSPRGGRPIGDVRNFLNAVHWMLRTGSPWRALPEKYGSWKTVYSRFRRWQKRGYLTAILKLLTLQADMNHIMIDGTYVHAHKHSAGARHTLESIRLSAEVVAALLPKFMRWWMLSVICWLLLSRQDNTPSILKLRTVKFTIFCTRHAYGLLQQQGYIFFYLLCCTKCDNRRHDTAIVQKERHQQELFLYFVDFPCLRHVHA